MLTAALFGRWLCRRRLSAPEQRHLDAAVPWMVFGATIGARLFYLVSRPQLWSAPNDWLKFWQGGMVSYGGLSGALLSLYFYRRRNNLPYLSLLDQLGPSLLLAWGVGRLGCFLNWYGEGGTPSDLPWALQIDGSSFHPVMLYTAILLSLFGLFLGRTGLARLGQRSALCLLSYGSVRLFCDTWRQYETPGILNLSRLSCVLIVLLALGLLRHSGRIPPTDVESSH